MQESQPGWAGISGPADLTALLIQLGHCLCSKANGKREKTALKKNNTFFFILFFFSCAWNFRGCMSVHFRKETKPTSLSFKRVRLVKWRWSFKSKTHCWVLCCSGAPAHRYFGDCSYEEFICSYFQGREFWLCLYHYLLRLLVGWQAISNPGEENVDRRFSYFDVQNIALHHYLVMEKEKQKKRLLWYMCEYISMLLRLFANTLTRRHPFYSSVCLRLLLTLLK